MTTHESADEGTPGQEPDDAGGGARERRDHGASGQASGKQFQRGTRAHPDTGTADDAAATTGAGRDGTGSGGSASGKQFARGTDSDSDGHGQPGPAGT